MTDTMLQAGTRDAFGGEVADLDEGKREALVKIPWEVMDTYRTDFGRDAFDDYLGRRLPAMCWQHQKAEPIGRAIAHQKGQRAHEFQLRFSDFDAVPRARQAFTQWADGDLTDVSFYYNNGNAIPHPSGERGAYRFTKADMPEISPVTVGSIPGAIVTGVRSEADMAGVAELVRQGIATPEEARGLLGLAGEVPSIAASPERERITVGTRSIILTIGDDGTVTSSSPDGTPVSAAAQPTGGDIETVTTLAQAVDAALDGYSYYVANIDRDTLDPDLQQALSLADAASVTVDSLLDEMGVEDPDDDDLQTGDGGRAADDSLDPGDTSGERAAVSDKPWSDFAESDYTDAQYKAACLIVLGDGSTKADCKLPIQEPDGTLNRKGVHAAAGALAGGRGGVDAPMAAKVAAAKTLLGIYRDSLKEDPPASLVSLSDGKRSEEEELEAIEFDLQARFATMDRRLA